MGLRYVELCIWVTPGASPFAIPGMAGCWNGPVATMTCRAHRVPWLVVTRKTPPCSSTCLTRVFGMTGRSNRSAYAFR